MFARKRVAGVVAALAAALVLVVVWQSQYALGAQEETPQDVTRSSFPHGFVFGAASAAYQYEGAAREEGRGPSIWDTFAHKSGKIKGNATGDVAVDQYHRFQEDMWLLKDLNMDAYRFSISWSRIFPRGVGEVNWKGVKYYDKLIEFLTTLGIQPWVTLYHWDMPQALEDTLGGWLSPHIVDAFEQYARFCFQRWGGRVKHWITLNEIHSFAVDGYGIGSKAPGRCSPPWGECPAGNSTTEPYLVGHHALLSHARVVRLYREEFQDVQKGVIGITLDSSWFEPLDANSARDKQASQAALEGFLGWFLDPIFFGEYPASMRRALGSAVLPSFTREQQRLVRGSQDFIGINHYTSNYATYDPTTGAIVRTPYKNGVPIGNQTASYWLFVVPGGMQKLMGWIRERYNNPIVYITENGRTEENRDKSMTLKDQLQDPERIQYYHDYLQSLLWAQRNGSDIRGYFAWSLMDNYEWAAGYTVRFGIYYVDYKNHLARYPKDSAFWFQRILKRDGLVEG